MIRIYYTLWIGNDANLLTVEKRFQNMKRKLKIHELQLRKKSTILYITSCHVTNSISIYKKKLFQSLEDQQYLFFFTEGSRHLTFDYCIIWLF